MHFLGIDTSATFSKALLIDESGCPGYLTHPLDILGDPQPATFWNAVAGMIQKLIYFMHSTRFFFFKIYKLQKVHPPH